jgi:hypothetical protein
MSCMLELNCLVDHNVTTVKISESKTVSAPKESTWDKKLALRPTVSS